MLNQFLQKYLVMGSQDCMRPPEEVLKEALQAGITAFQYREKGNGACQGKEKQLLGEKLRLLCREYRVPFFVNDDVALAIELDADGIHVGQDDADVTEIRIKYPNLFIGLSVSNEAEVEESPLQLVDYIGAGPIFPTSSKADAKQPVGPEWITRLRQQYPYLPIVGIGGITTENASAVLAAGADGVAVISAISMADNIQAIVRQF